MDILVQFHLDFSPSILSALQLPARTLAIGSLEGLQLERPLLFYLSLPATISLER